jgi:hypothetical protein
VITLLIGVLAVGAAIGALLYFRARLL